LKNINLVVFNDKTDELSGVNWDILQKGGKVIASEVSQLMRAGYTLVGNYWYPPGEAPMS